MDAVAILFYGYKGDIGHHRLFVELMEADTDGGGEGGFSELHRKLAKKHKISLRSLSSEGEDVGDLLIAAIDVMAYEQGTFTPVDLEVRIQQEEDARARLGAFFEELGIDVSGCTPPRWWLCSRLSY